LLIGSPWLIAWTAATAVGGIWLVTIGVVGFASRPVGPALRVLFAAIGLALFIPPDAFPGALPLELAGLLGAAGLLGWLHLQRRTFAPEAGE
jgi:TRAP-type uncharacterized transport system fused permease subunit